LFVAVSSTFSSLVTHAGIGFTPAFQRAAAWRFRGTFKPWQTLGRPLLGWKLKCEYWRYQSTWVLVEVVLVFSFSCLFTFVMSKQSCEKNIGLASENQMDSWVGSQNGWLL
jgi:hypothetical protein